MESLFVPMAEVGPHWFFRYRVIDRVYVAVTIGFLIRAYVLMSQIYDIDSLNRYAVLPLDMNMRLCLGIALFGLLVLWFTRLIPLLSIASVVLDLQLEDGVFRFVLFRGYDQAISSLYHERSVTHVLFFYLLVKLLMLMSKMIKRRIDYYRTS